MLLPIRLVVFVVVVAAVSSAYDALGDQTYDSDEAADTQQATYKRNGECSVIGAKCFNSRQCCGGYICAVLDEEGGNKPEVPGYCVKSKDLQTCSVEGGSEPGDECPSGHRCMALGRMGQKYCLPLGGRGIGVQLLPDFRSIKMTDRRRYHGPGATKAIGKLGSSCVTDLDCTPRSEDGLHHMCCQLVNQGRQGTKRICDRVTPISACTSV